MIVFVIDINLPNVRNLLILLYFMYKKNCVIEHVKEAVGEKINLKLIVLKKIHFQLYQ